MKVVLVVDDSATMRRMIVTSLREIQDIRCEEASNGMEAVEKLVLEQYDLVLLDLNMPDMHGLDVLRFLQAHARFRGIPVIVLTTRGDEASRVEALNSGATAYLTKPFSPPELAGCVVELLNKN